MSTPVIAPCEAADLPAVVALVNAAYRGEGGWTNEVDAVAGERITIPQLLEELAAEPGAVVEVLRLDGEVQACVRLDPATAADGGPALYIGMLAVRPGRQAQGLGRQLLEHAEAVALRQGRRTARISVVFDRDTLIAWYERRGYVRTGETLPFHTDGRYGAPKRGDLYLVVLEKALG